MTCLPCVSLPQTKQVRTAVFEVLQILTCYTFFIHRLVGGKMLNMSKSQISQISHSQYFTTLPSNLLTKWCPHTIFTFPQLKFSVVAYLECWCYHLTDLMSLWADLVKIWNEVFCSEATPIEYAEMLDNLRSKYCLKQWYTRNEGDILSSQFLLCCCIPL